MLALAVAMTMAACPVTPRHHVSPQFSVAAGSGPAFAAGLSRGSVLRIAPPSQFNSRHWGGNKILWVRRPGGKGTLVVRGRRLDAPGKVRFNRGDVPPDHLDLAEPDSGWGGYPSYTRVREPGCYEWEITGPGVHEVIVFRAARARR